MFLVVPHRKFKIVFAIREVLLCSTITKNLQILKVAMKLKEDQFHIMTVELVITDQQAYYYYK